MRVSPLAQAPSPACDPSLAVYYDFNNVGGAYVEGSAGYSLPVSEGFSVDLGALAGFSAGQEVDVNDPAQAANFASVDLDANTRVTGPGVAQQDVGTKVWFGLSLGWSR